MKRILALLLVALALPAWGQVSKTIDKRLRALEGRAAGTGLINAVEAFGAKGDGSTDNTGSFAAARTYLQAHDGATLLLPPGTYLYSDNTWLSGIRNVRVVGYGANLKNTHAAVPYDFNSIALYLGTDWWSLQLITTFQPAYKIQTLNAGTATVTFVNAADAANFAAGDVLLVHGYNQFTGGWPPSARFKEVAVVASVNPGAGTLVLTRAAMYTYDSRWKDAGPWSGVVYNGAPRVMKLSGRTPALPESVSIEGVTFLKGPNEPAYYGGVDYGAIYVGGVYGAASFKDIRAGNVVLSCGRRFEIRNSTVEKVEIDKSGGSVLFDNVEADIIAGATSFDSVTVRASRIKGYTSLQGTSVLLEDNDLYDSGQGSLGAFAMLGGIVNVARGNRIWRAASDTTKLVFLAGNGTGAMSLGLPVGVPTSTHVEFAYSDVLSQALQYGSRIYTTGAAPNEGSATAVYYNSGANTLAVDAADGFRFVPNGADAWSFSPVRRLSLLDNIEMLVNDVGGPLAQYGELTQPYNNRVEEIYTRAKDRHGTFFFPFPRNANNNVFYLPDSAVIDSIRWYVLTAGSGYDPQISTTGTPFVVYSVKGNLAGVREQTIFAVHGVQAGDGLANLPVMGPSVNQYNFSYTGAGPTYPRGFVRVDYTLAPGPFTLPLAPPDSSVGTITLTSGTPSTGTATVRSGASCVCTNATTQANPIKCAVAATTLTATGPNTVTDSVTYACF